MKTYKMETKNNKFKVYHKIPQDLTGEYLLPLNKFKVTNPDLYERYVEKYNGRKELLERTIPKLNCYWNDVIFFSPIHPRKIHLVFDDIGIKYKESKWFEISIDNFENIDKNMVVYFYRKKEKGDFRIDEEDVIRFNKLKFAEIDEIPEETLNYYQRSHDRKDDKLFTFHGIPHVLYKGKVRIENLNRICLPGN